MNGKPDPVPNPGVLRAPLSSAGPPPPPLSSMMKAAPHPPPPGGTPVSLGPPTQGPLGGTPVGPPLGYPSEAASFGSLGPPSSSLPPPTHQYTPGVNLLSSSSSSPFNQGPAPNNSLHGRNPNVRPPPMNGMSSPTPRGPPPSTSSSSAFYSSPLTPSASSTLGEKAPSLSGNMMRPPSFGNPQAPPSSLVGKVSSGTIQPPSSLGNFQPPPMGNVLPSKALSPSGIIQPPSSMGNFQPPPMRNVQPSPSSMAANLSPPSRTVQPPSSMGSFQPPPSGSTQPPFSAANFQPPPTGSVRPPSSSGNFPPIGRASQPAGSGQSHLSPSGNFQPSLRGTLQPPPMGSVQPSSVGNVRAPPIGNAQHPSLGNFQHPSAGDLQPPSVGKNQPPPMGSAQPPPTGNVHNPHTSSLNGPNQNGNHNHQRHYPPVSTAGNGHQRNTNFNNRYPTKMYPTPHTPSGGVPYQNINQPPAGGDTTSGYNSNFTSSLGGLSLTQGMEVVDLLQNRHILPPEIPPPIVPKLQASNWNDYNCSPDLFRCTLTKIPETDALLKKSRLPLGILIHPFKDLSHLPVIQCSTIVRCRQCRTYINPFVHFVDQRRWKCNICYRVNELPEDFFYDPVTKTHGDPSRRPECRSSTIEFIAPHEYMLRPPQPAVYVFLLDVSRQALESGYIKAFCKILLEELDKLPGDGRTQVGFITYDKNVHFYSLPIGAIQPTQLTVCDIDDMFLPSPSDLLVNFREGRSLVEQLLSELPNMFESTYQTDSALGAALQAAYKMAYPTGGRISVFQNILPNIGPGALTSRENTEKKDSALYGPATDFYKKLSLDFCSQQIAVDLFAMGNGYMDLATVSGVSKFSGGQIQNFPGYHIKKNLPEAGKFENALRRYFTRKIGFEAVMRVRCTKGLTLTAFHGNFFVRSTDLLTLPNINPDAGFGMQIAIEDDLHDSREVCFQAALLYTTSKGERRIRVHTLCVPTTSSVTDVINHADQETIIGMLAKFAAEKAVNSSLSDAKEGLVVSCVDTFETYKAYSSMSTPTGLLISQSLKLLPMNVLATMRSHALRPGIRPDQRSFCFSQLKTLPLSQLLLMVYPSLYRVDNILEAETLEDEEGNVIYRPSRLQLSYERISATGMYLMDCGDMYYLYLTRGLHQMILERCLGVVKLQDVDENGYCELPENKNAESEALRDFISWLDSTKPYRGSLRVLREDTEQRRIFTERLVEDRADNSFSYFEFLQHLKQQIK